MSSWFDNPIFGRVRKAEAESEIDPRISRLSTEHRKTYETLLALREQNQKITGQPKGEAQAENALWTDFMLSLFALPGSIDLTPYTKDPVGFAAWRDRLTVVPICSENIAAHDSRKRYGQRDNATVEPHSGRHINLDAPYAVCLLLRHDEQKISVKSELQEAIEELTGDHRANEVSKKTSWEVLGVAGFTPSYGKDGKSALLVDQLQGGNTAHDPVTPLGQEAMALFKAGATYALFQVAEELARHADMNAIALRTREANDWPNVSVPKQQRTPYVVVPEAERRRFRRGEIDTRLRRGVASARSPYFWKSLDEGGEGNA